MPLTASPGGSLLTYITSNRGDLAGTATIRLEDSGQVVRYGPTTTGLTLIDSPGSQYVYKVLIATLPSPLADGVYALIVQQGSAVSVDTVEVSSSPLAAGAANEPSICALWVDPAAVKAAVSGLSDAAAARAALEASSILYELSGEAFPGECTVQVELDAAQRWFPITGDLWWMRFDAAMDFTSRWWNADQIMLAGWPITSIVEVRSADGSVVDPSLYELRDIVLVNVGSGAWVPETTVLYTVGMGPPLAGEDAALALAVNLAGPANACVLPGNTDQVTRQGVRATRTKASDLRSMGLTGLDAVDRFLRVYNPEGLRMPPGVWSPDINYPRRIG